LRIALISFTHSNNYGAQLQAYALEKYIEKTHKGVECSYIYYDRNFIKGSFKWLLRKFACMILNRDDNPSWTIKEYCKAIFWRSKGYRDTDTNAKFEKFWKLMNYDFHAGKSYRRRDLNVLNTKYDKFISGSDQIWNCGRLDLDPTYMLDFVTDDSKKFSYASSLGMREIPQKYYAKYKECLSSFRELSCREQEGADIISKLTGREVVHVLDPVFLLDKEEWIELIKSSVPIPKNGKYILIYTLSKDEVFVEKVKKYAAKKKESILVISDNRCNGQSTGPLEWLDYFCHADEVFTDSFHGTAFSVIFNKQFSVYIPDDSFFQDSKSRITGLLDELEICNRIIDETYCLDNIKDIDYDKVNDILSRLKTKSRDYLDRCLRE
jgi:hypothetical protein